MYMSNYTNYLIIGGEGEGNYTWVNFFSSKKIN